MEILISIFAHSVHCQSRLATFVSYSYICIASASAVFVDNCSETSAGVRPTLTATVTWVSLRLRIPWIDRRA
eukprot:6202472-Pleurochrysis_carterae.AAC.2